MILKDTNSGPVWTFSKQECSDYAYICACLPSEKLDRREEAFVRQVEVKFRKGGGYLTQGQWDWFAGIAERFSSYILDQDDAAAAIRRFAASL